MNLPRLITGADDVPSTVLRRVFAHWRALAGERIAPRRNEISPADLKFALPILWMWDVVDGGKDFEFRLAGERIRSFINIDYRHKRLSAFPRTAFSDEVGQVFARCVEMRRPLIVGPAPMTYEPRRHHIVTTIVLPLSENGVDVTNLIGATEAEAMAQTEPATQAAG
jgi:hypothetical protein